MKKIIASALLILAGSLVWAANSSLTVSSGTYLAVDGFLPANSQFRQAINIADPSTTAGVAPVDAVGGLTVRLATSSAVGIGTVVLSTSGASASTTTVVVSGTPSVSISGTPSVSVSGTAIVQPIGITTVTFNGTAQPVSKSGDWTINQSTIGVISATPLTVTGSTVGVVQFTNPWLVQSTYTVVSTTYAISVAGTFSPPALTTVTFNGTAQPVSQSGDWKINQSTIGVISATPLTVTGSTVGVILQTGGTVQVIGSTVGVVTPSTITAVVINSTVGVTGTITANAGTGSFYVGTSTVGIMTPSGTSIMDFSTSAVAGLLTSSTAFQTATNQGQIGQANGSSIGQIMVTGVPYQMVSATTSVNVSSQTGTEFIIISSASASQYTYLCGCVFNNSSATNSFLTLYQTSSTVSGVDFMQIGTPANDIPVGVWPGCTDPFFRSKVGGQITLKANATVSSTAMRCIYYQAP